MEQYIDEDFNGVALNIDIGFIMTNPELVDALKTLQSSLEACQFSTMMPNHRRNINELNDWKDKTDTIRAKNKAEKQRSDEIRSRDLARRRALIGHIILPIEFVRVDSFSGDINSLTIEGKEYDMYKDIFTNNLNLRAEFKRVFNDFISRVSRENWYKFVDDNNLFIKEEMDNPLYNFRSVRLKVDKFGNLVLTHELPYVQVYKDGANMNKLYYRRVNVSYNTRLKKYYANNILHNVEHSEYHEQGCRKTVSYLGGYELIGKKEFVRK